MAIMLPPGITAEHTLSHFASGGEVFPWREFAEVRLYTNAYVVHDGKLLLGYKKRGFGEGMYNGFGGKVEPGESAAEAAVRELQEEAGIRAPLEHVGVLLFTTPEKPWAFHIDIYLAHQYSDNTTETDEMRPVWFPIEEDSRTGEITSLPFDKMWEEDRYWLPLILKGKRFVGRADFGYNEKGEATKLERWWFATHD